MQFFLTSGITQHIRLAALITVDIHHQVGSVSFTGNPTSIFIHKFYNNKVILGSTASNVESALFKQIAGMQICALIVKSVMWVKHGIIQGTCLMFD
jgi:hypothetical protein